MNNSPGSILIVDDTRLNLEIMKSLLQNDYAIFTAADGLTGLQMAQTEKVDLILLDINMPGMDGYEVCARLKSDPATENIPVIFVTARNDVTEETKGLALGAIDYIIKPISAPVVKARVRNHMRMKQFQDRLAQSEMKLRELSLSDELTGLFNRRGFTILAEQQIKLSRRLQQGFSLFFADMDGMKWINDHLGHSVGDQALQELTKILIESFRASDIVARIGGDEFVCLSVDASPAEIAANLARLQQNIAKSNLCASRAYSLSLSIGAATFDPANPIDLETLLAEADKQMYIAKKSKIRNTG